MSVDQRPGRKRGRLWPHSIQRPSKGQGIENLLQILLEGLSKTQLTHPSGNFIYQNVKKVMRGPTQEQVLINQNKLSGRGEVSGIQSRILPLFGVLKPSRRMYLKNPFKKSQKNLHRIPWAKPL